MERSGNGGHVHIEEVAGCARCYVPKEETEYIQCRGGKRDGAIFRAVDGVDD